MADFTARQAGVVMGVIGFGFWASVRKLKPVDAWGMFLEETTKLERREAGPRDGGVDFEAKREVQVVYFAQCRR